MFWRNFIVNGISIFLGIMFFTAGMAKLYFEHKFPGIMGPISLEDALTKYNLGLFARFIAYAQVLIGFILLTLRYRTIGAIMLLPMLLNILFITVSMKWVGTPYVITFFLLLNLVLLIADAPRLLHLIGMKLQLPEANASSPIRLVLYWVMGFLLVLASIQLSFVHLTSAYLVAGTGTVISFLPYLQAGRAGAAHKPGKAEELKHLSV